MTIYSKSQQSVSTTRLVASDAEILRRSLSDRLRMTRHFESRLKGGRGVDPQEPGFGFAGIAPAMRGGALKIKTVAGLETVVFVSVKPDFEFAAKDVQKLLAFVSVGFAAAAAGLDAEEVRLHGSVAPGQQLHANAFGGLEDFALRGANHAGIVGGRFKEGKDVGVVITSDAAERSDGSAHLAAFERAEKADRDAGSASDLGQREAFALAKAPETKTGGSGIFGGSGNHPLAFEHVDDGCGIQAASAAKKNGAFQQADVGFLVQAITA